MLFILKIIMVNQNNDTIASLLPPDVFNRLSKFERRILTYVLQRPSPKFALWQQVAHGSTTGMVVGFRYQSLKTCFSDGDAYIGWHYYFEDEAGDVELFYENNLKAVEDAQP